MDLPSSVAPFILRGVSLLGIDSVQAPKPLRIEAWTRLARDLDPAVYETISSTVPLDGVVDAGRAILAGEIRGRVVVEVAPAA
jgi:acrylyl-CoA reductase (NADPH)